MTSTRQAATMRAQGLTEVEAVSILEGRGYTIDAAYAAWNNSAYIAAAMQSEVMRVRQGTPLAILIRTLRDVPFLVGRATHLPVSREVSAVSRAS